MKPSPSFSPKRLLRPRAGPALAWLVIFGLALPAVAGGGPGATSIFRPASSNALAVHRYSLFVLGITGAIFVVVFTMLVVAVIRFRRRPGDDEAEPPQVYGSDQVEVAWTVIPVLIVIVLALTTARTVFEVQDRAKPAGALEVTAIGRQWWWEFRYPQLGIVTANELHIPVSDAAHPAPTFIQLQSADVAHSFWVPRLAGKTDLIPNKVNETWVDPSEPGLRSAFEPVHIIETYVTGEVEGLSVGSEVTLRGVTVGKVQSITFSWNTYGDGTPRCVVIRCEIKQSFSPVKVGSSDSQVLIHDNVEKGMRAVVQGQGITGTSIVALKYLDPKKYPPLTVSWTPKYAYIPSAPSEFGQILAAVNKTLSHLEKLDVGKLEQSIDRTLSSADLALQKLSQLDVKGISNNVNRVAGDAGEAINEIKGLVQDARGTLKGMKLDAVGVDTSRLVNNLDARLATLLDKLSAVDVRALNETLAGTREAARSLNEVLEELKRYPSGFLLGPPPEPASGLEKEKK